LWVGGRRGWGFRWGAWSTCGWLSIARFHPSQPVSVVTLSGSCALLQMGPKAFQFFKEYLAISNSTALDQPLRKFDFVTVPGKAGAMEVRCAGLVSS